MRNPLIKVALPINILENCNDLRSKTIKIGQIGRACAIFKVKMVMLYPLNKRYEKKFSKDVKIITEILKYLDCPQYLRKYLFPKIPELKYVGALPPLRTPHHPLERKFMELPSKSIREGVVVSSNSSSSIIDVGLEKPIQIAVPNLPIQKRIILKLEQNKDRLYGIPIAKDKVEKYWGFYVRVYDKPLKSLMKQLSDHIIIATSKLGNSIVGKAPELKERIKKNHKVILFFGSPSLGLFDIFKMQHLKLEDWANFILNFVPHQGTQTLRVEEALFSTLAILNYLINL
ncbi:MAG: putative RNA uridine N3 methyltransferase [Candidatus Helarchaeota archaeon]